MKVLVEEAGVVQPGRHDGQGLGELLADLRTERLGPFRELALDELVERDRGGDRQRDQVILEQELPLPLLAQRDRRDRRHADRGQVLRSACPRSAPCRGEPTGGAWPANSGTRKCLM